MNEILQKRIEEAAIKVSDVCEPCDYGDPFCASCHRPYMYDAAKKMGEVILNNQWISVEEALPEIKEHFMSEDVLCKYSDGSMGFDYLKENIFGQQWFEHECEESVVTHWMLIPQLKGGENE